MPLRFSTELAILGKELARVRNDITHSDSIALSPTLTVRERAASHRAATYVWMASVLERVVHDALQATVREIAALALPSSKLRPSLFALLCEAELTSIAARSRSTAWDMKISIFNRMLDATPAALSEDVLPLDGKTIRGEHFDTIWLVLGLSGASLPSPLHRFALRDLADGRNEVAHGHLDPVSFGRKKATADLLRLTDRVDDVAAHLLGELDAYLQNGLFVR